jgi:hypothetical protein
MQVRETAVVDQRHGVGEHRFGLGREAGDEIGAEHHVRAQAARFGGERDGLGAAVAALHALQDHVVAGLEAEMEMRHQPRLFGDQPQEIVVDLRDVERRQPEALELRHLREQAAHHLAECGPAGKIGAERGEIDARQHELGDSGLDQRSRLADDVADRHAARRPAAVGNDAEGAAVVAALLDLDEGPGAALEAADEM